MKIEFERTAEALKGHLELNNSSGLTKRGISAFEDTEERKSVLPEVPETSPPKDFRIPLAVIYDFSKHSFLIAFLQGEL